MPTNNFLSSEEKESLQQALKKENRPEVRERIWRSSKEGNSFAKYQLI